MADVTTKLTDSTRTPGQDVGAFNICKKFAVVSGTAAQNDYVQLLTFGRATRVVANRMRVDATLGASCVATLFRNSGGVHTQIGAATTAGGASVVDSAAQGAFDFAVGDILEVKVTGAGITASANFEVDVLCDTSRAILAGE